MDESTMKIYLLKAVQAKLLAAGVAVLTVGSMIVAGVFQQGVMTSAGEQYLPIYSVETPKKKISLTFDAAWENSDTDILIELLDQYQVKATFFATGDWVSRYPEDVKKLFNAGHEIQNHSDSHPHPNQLSREELVEDTYACDKKIKELTGVFPNLYRTPYGEYNDQVISTLNSLGKKTIQWDVDSIDWKDPTPQEMYDRVVGKVTNGSILLFHNDKPNTPEALRMILPELKKQGYEFVTVNDLLVKGKFHINSNGRMIKDES